MTPGTTVTLTATIHRIGGGTFHAGSVFVVHRVYAVNRGTEQRVALCDWRGDVVLPCVDSSMLQLERDGNVSRVLVDRDVRQCDASVCADEFGGGVLIRKRPDE